MLAEGAPKDEVNPVVEVGGHKGAFQGCAVGLQEVGRAMRPFWQLHITHQLPILALAQGQVIKVHEEAAHSAVSTTDLPDAGASIRWPLSSHMLLTSAARICQYGRGANGDVHGWTLMTLYDIVVPVLWA